MPDSFSAKTPLSVGSASYSYFKLGALYAKFPQAERLPFSLKILLENLLRTEDGVAVRAVDIEALATVDVTAQAQRENQRNKERYQFLKWGQTAFRNFKVVPPDQGIVHQVNLEYLARVVMKS